MGGDDTSISREHETACVKLGLTGDERDRMADERDRTSELQDKAADARNQRAKARDAAVASGLASAPDRAESARDREEAERDRSHAAADRHASWLDRASSAGDRTLAAVDQLTGAHSRDAGLIELDREIARAKRTGQPYVLAFVDLDGLKATNDSLGHAAGDRRLRQTADAIRANVRSYDLILRLGGDEFMCGLTGLKMKEAVTRFVLVNAALAEALQEPITVGLADLEPDDSLTSISVRADAAMYKERQRRL